MTNHEQQVEMAFAKQQQHSPVNGATIPSPSPSPSSSCVCDDAKLRKAEIALRLLTLISSVCAFSFLITDKQSRSFLIYQSVITQEAHFSDMKALVYSIITLGIIALYTLAQIGRFLVSSGHSLHPASSLAWAVFLLDQIMTYLLLTSSAATAQSAYFSEQGNDAFGWPKVCYLYEHFCQQVGAGIVGSFVAFMGLVFTSVISAFHLFASSSFEE